MGSVGMESPQIIASDRGANLTSTLWNALASSLGTKIMHTMAYNPEANGIIKRLHRSPKISLTTKCLGRSWRKELPWVLLGLRMMPQAAFNASPAEVLYGQVLLPADVFQEKTNLTSPSDTQKIIERMMPAKTTYYVNRKMYIPQQAAECKICVHTGGCTQTPPPLSPAYSGPPHPPETTQVIPDDSRWKNDVGFH
ncbi:uncharacterized protein [Macrobrachium rosenbergii]|uniref:uncharacterized protein n=1 Tax=Macrobrachium rosenbergii TaxID=79674 RepID=UPI0034D78CB3